MRETTMQKLILISFFVLIAVACSPSQGQTSIPPTLAPVEITLTPGPTLPATLPASETPTAMIPVDASVTAPVAFTGAVQIAGGSCCIGGFAGETIQAQVSFSAASPFGRVSEMRVRPGCSADTDMESVAWEPFVDSKTLPVQVIINWVGFTVCVQYQDEYGNLSPVYRDDISVEGMPRAPVVNPTDWYPQIQCFAETEVHPGPGEIVTGGTVTFSWPDKNQLPEGVFYKVYAYGASDNFTGLVASGQTRETSISLSIDPARAGEIGWYMILVDANGTQLDHGQCSSFAASLLTVDPPEGLKAIFFQYQP
jgi:hypothetical protein